MNQLAIIRKHLKGIDKAWDGISTAETTGRAQKMIMDGCARYGVMLGGYTAEIPAPSVVMAIPEAVVGVSIGGEGLGSPVGEVPAEWLKTAAVDGLVEAFKNDGVVEVVGDLGGEEREVSPVEIVGGWPVSAEGVVVGRMPNRIYLKVQLRDGRKVAMQREGKSWKVGDEVKMALVRGGMVALFKQVGVGG